MNLTQKQETELMQVYDAWRKCKEEKAALFQMADLIAPKEYVG